MPRLTLDPSLYRWTDAKNGDKIRLLSKADFERFNLDLLGLGNVLATATPVDTIAAMFDLQGFTNFCKQIEPQFPVPIYLNAYLTWVMEQLRNEMKHSDIGNDVGLWCPLPYYVKFLGDGLLILWDASQAKASGHRNVVLSAYEICRAYKRNFLPTIRDKVVEPPPGLRCGLARGTVLSVGEGADYVGSCINMAARVQKLPGTSFAFNKRGFELEGNKPEPAVFFTRDIVVKEIAIRGIGDHELVCILRSEAEALSAKDKKFFKAVGKTPS